MLKSTPRFHNSLEILYPTPFVYCHKLKTSNKGEQIYISDQSSGDSFEGELNRDFQNQVAIPLENLEVALNTYEISFKEPLKIIALIVTHNSEKLNIWSKEVQDVSRQIRYQRISQFLYLNER
ncbi:endoribonuclease L-PSP [Photobacterium leiognathi lrivu.4.1]|uniref:Endoribonuclease L-PSP n=1 Tax=Photobacterium leiognathi lrivu.4.1 TaxID=1248232 RepID=X0P813_PHOLE|nr:hypothetical protein [Photobacterium leiognathi]GAD29498.1 endoribonuclease L-PSP [Photobacterium leiognathi lrivu.4.1]